MARGKRPAHVLQLLLCGHLLREQCSLNAVEEPLEPADELSLRDTQLGIRWRLIVEWQCDSLELLDQLRSQALLQLGDRAAMDLGEAGAAGLVQRRAADLFEQPAKVMRIG